MTNFQRIAKGLMLSGLAFFSMLLMSHSVNAQTCGFVAPGDIPVTVSGGVPTGTVGIQVDYIPAGSTTATIFSCGGLPVNGLVGIPAGASIINIHVDAGFGFQLANKLPAPGNCIPATASGACGLLQVEIHHDPGPAGDIIHVN